MNVKLIFSILASVIVVVAYYPYVRDIFKGKTKPHIYTWLIWFLTTITALAGLLKGGSINGATPIMISLVLVFSIVVLSLKYGTKDITIGDTVVLTLALLSIVVWWQLEQPVLAVFMATAIDLFGYIPTIRKSWNAPQEETFSFWVAMVVIYSLVFLAISEYNLLTVPYVVMCIIVDLLLVILLFYRRKVLKNKKA